MASGATRENWARSGHGLIIDKIKMFENGLIHFDSVRAGLIWFDFLGAESEETQRRKGAKENRF
jgi:hypothetical protein